MDEHVPTLRSPGLVTDCEPIIMEAEDGTVVEVFEWKSAEALEAAHTEPVVLENGLRGPSSTWTYRVNDVVLTETQQFLFVHGSSAFSAGAAFVTCRYC